jgi:hypothetical protein
LASKAASACSGRICKVPTPECLTYFFSKATAIQFLFNVSMNELNSRLSVWLSCRQVH